MCPDDTFECPHGRVDGQQPPCISTEQRCDNVTDCIGGEDELEHNCPCGPEGAVRLVDGIVPYRGRLEYCRNERWTTMCNSNYYDRRRRAAVVCLQLGFPTQGSSHVNVALKICHFDSFYKYVFGHVFNFFGLSIGAQSYCCGRFGAGHTRQPLFWDYFYCNGNEANLGECRREKGNICNHNQDISIVCS